MEMRLTQTHCPTVNVNQIGQSNPVSF